MTYGPTQAVGPRPSRRAVARGMAWSVPVVATSAVAPAIAASQCTASLEWTTATVTRVSNEAFAWQWDDVFGPGVDVRLRQLGLVEHADRGPDLPPGDGKRSERLEEAAHGVPRPSGQLLTARHGQRGGDRTGLELDDLRRIREPAAEFQSREHRVEHLVRLTDLHGAEPHLRLTPRPPTRRIAPHLGTPARARWCETREVVRPAEPLANLAPSRGRGRRAQPAEAAEPAR